MALARPYRFRPRQGLAALKDPQSVLIVAPENKAMAVLDRRSKRLFYARGSL